MGHAPPKHSTATEADPRRSDALSKLDGWPRARPRLFESSVWTAPDGTFQIPAKVRSGTTQERRASGVHFAGEVALRW
ncbi:hypothetical protein GCM10011504_22250 [Siccirubricoccus deserti]|nr:hypothetical protein GCM10011504_22250 [Siccirubricoccus deserti]